MVTRAKAGGKKGWIELVEAFIAILLIGGVMLIFVNQESGNSSDVSSNVYRDEIAMLRAVETNDSLRSDILGISQGSLPAVMGDSAFPESVKAMLDEKNPGYLTCDAKICGINDECEIENAAKADIYTRQATIFADLDTYSPRKLVISCTL
jgi:hypothetical protein